MTTKILIEAGKFILQATIVAACFMAVLWSAKYWMPDPHKKEKATLSSLGKSIDTNSCKVYRVVELPRITYLIHCRVKDSNP